MPYRAFFGLEKEPFSNAPQTSFYYSSPQHERAIKKLTYAIDHAKGLAVLVGRVGSGKTMLARRMLAELPEERYAAALLVIVHSGFGADWLLKRIALQLGVANPASEKLALVSQLYRRLIKLHEQKRTAVVLIDEAQMLETREIMEELRGLLNLEVPGRKLINFVLCGLPELDQTLTIDEPLHHRVAVRCELQPFEESDTRDYIRHRLMLAGALDSSIFSSAALDAVHAWSGGTPRSINTLCDNALFEAALTETRVIGPEIIAQCARELKFADPYAPAVPEIPPVPAAPPDDVELAEIDDLLADLDRY